LTVAKKVLWKYDAPNGFETHTAQLIGKDYVVFVQNGNPAKVLVMNIKTNQVVNIPVQAIELTPDKKIVWALRSWEKPTNLGPSTIIQLLNDSNNMTEKVHFDDIK
jgi:hypothetical protein